MWSIWEITNNPVWLIEGSDEKWLEIGLESELSQEGAGEPLEDTWRQRGDRIPFFALREVFSIFQPYRALGDKYKNLISRSCL